MRYEVWKDNGSGIWLFVHDGEPVYAHRYDAAMVHMLLDDVKRLHVDADTGWWDGNDLLEWSDAYEGVTERTDSTLVFDGTIYEEV